MLLGCVFVVIVLVMFLFDWRSALISAAGRLVDAKDPASRRTGLLQRLRLWLPGRSGGARV